MGPWKKNCCANSENKFFSELPEKNQKSPILFLLKVYKKIISPLLPRACRFYPTCSEYMAGAISLHGSAKGVWLGIYRLLRCQPLCKAGYDPVPERFTPFPRLTVQIFPDQDEGECQLSNEGHRPA